MSANCLRTPYSSLEETTIVTAAYSGPLNQILQLRSPNAQVQVRMSSLRTSPHTG